MWCWGMDKIKWTHHVRNEEVLQRVKEERNILHNLQQRKGRFNLIGHIFRMNCLLKHVTETQKAGEEEEEHVSSYWKTIKK
jgi:hypothetical protein